MHNEKKISLTFDLGQVANDLLVKCNQVSRSVRDEAMDDIKASVLEPDSPESRSIINRAVTEAFGAVKGFCQRYLKQGRTIDDNSLERMVKNITYVIKQAEDTHGHLLYSCKEDGVEHEVYRADVTSVATQWRDAITGEVVTPDSMPEPIMYETDEIDTIDYEKILLELFIPNFNVAVTDHLKSMIHRYVVDYTMASFLQDQLPEKAGEYMTLAEGKDHDAITKDLNAREKFNFRKPAWI